MSNSSGKNISKNIRSPAPTSAKSKRWSFIQSDLKQAHSTWAELEKAKIVISPEEEQFEKIKSVIAQLKLKLEQF